MKPQLPRTLNGEVHNKEYTLPAELFVNLPVGDKDVFKDFDEK